MALTLRLLDVGGEAPEGLLVSPEAKILSVTRTTRGYMLKAEGGALFQYEGRQIKDAQWLDAVEPAVGFQVGVCNDGDIPRFKQWLEAMKHKDAARMDILSDLIRREQESRNTSKVDIPDCWIRRKLGEIRSVTHIPVGEYLAMANDFHRAGREDVSAYFEQILCGAAWKRWKAEGGPETDLLAQPLQRPGASQAFQRHRGAMPDAVFSALVKKFYGDGHREVLAVLRSLEGKISDSPKKG